jgi:M6 family metalloprotease-like protein
MLSLKKKTLMWGLTAALVGTVGFVAAMDNNANIFKATDTPTKQCVGIYFGNADYTTGSTQIAANSTTTGGSQYYTVTSPASLSFGISTISGSAAYKSANTTSTSYALKLGSGSAGGSLTMNFSNSYVVTQAKITYKRWSADSSFTASFAVTSGTKTFTVSNSSNVTLSDTADSSVGCAVLTDLAGTSGTTTSNSFTISTPAKNNRIHIYKIVLTINGAGTPSTPTENGKYTLISGTSDLVAGDSYIIGNGNSSGTADFMANQESTSGGTDIAVHSETIDTDATVTPTSGTEQFILGGSTGAWTLKSTERTTNGYLASSSTGSYALFVEDVATLTDYHKWTIGFSGGIAQIQNNGKAKYIEHYTYSGESVFDVDLVTNANVYLFRKTASIAGPSLTISPTSLSLTAGSSDGTITATPATGATLSITNSNDTVATATLTNETITVHPLSAGTTTVSVIATKDGLSTTKTCTVTVAAAPTPTVTLSASTLTITGSDKTDNSITVSVSNFSATPTYTVTSTDENVVVGSVENGKLVILTGTITTQSTQTLTVTATYNTETSSANVVLTIKPVVAVTAVTVAGSDSVTVGATITLTATVTGGTAKTVTWSSSNTATATVDSTGVVTGKAVGTVTITATSTEDATKSGTKAITVAAATVTDPIIATSTASSLKYSQVEASSDVYTLPSTGTTAKPVKMLVLPISITDYSSNATAANLTQIKKTLGDGYDASATGWQTLKSFYNTSSYGKLNLEVTVASYTSAKSVNGWYNSGLSTSTIISGNDSYQSKVASMMSDALANYKTASGSSCTDFDTDGNGYIDGVIAVYSAPDMEQHTYTDSNDTFWAFTYQAYTSSGYALTASTTSPVVHKYFWASYDFMTEGSYYPSTGAGNTASSTTAATTIAADAHTFIHESGHIMGLDDYYDYDNTCEPMGEVDMMDYNIIDHNAFSKFSLGWENAQVITGTGGSLTLTLTPSATNSGQIVLIPTGNDGTGWNKSAFDEYIMMEFYTPTGLNAKDASYAYATRPQAMTENGVRIYHVDARLCKVTYSSSGSSTVGAYVDSITTSSTVSTVVSHSNTVKYGTKDTSYKLLTALDHAGVVHRSTTASVNNETLWQAGDTFNYSTYSSQFDVTTGSNDGNGFHYSVAFSNMSASGITLTITHVA